MRTATYIVGVIATLLALAVAVLIVLFATTIAYGQANAWILVSVFVLIALVYLAGPVTGILLARRGRTGVGLAMAIVSLLISLGLVGLLPTLIGAAAQ